MGYPWRLHYLINPTRSRINSINLFFACLTPLIYYTIRELAKTGVNMCKHPNLLATRNPTWTSKKITRMGEPLKSPQTHLEKSWHRTKNKTWLVVYLPLWKIWKSVGIIIPNFLGKSNSCSKPPTRNTPNPHNITPTGTTFLGRRPGVPLPVRTNWLALLEVPRVPPRDGSVVLEDLVGLEMEVAGKLIHNPFPLLGGAPVR